MIDDMKRRNSTSILTWSGLAVLPGVPRSHRPADDTGREEYQIGFEGECENMLRSFGLNRRNPPSLRMNARQAIVSVFPGISPPVGTERPYSRSRAEVQCDRERGKQTWI